MEINILFAETGYSDIYSQSVHFSLWL